MENFEKQLIKKQSETIGNLMSTVIELDLKYSQALATAEALATELEGLKNGDTKQPDAAGLQDGDASRVQQG